MGVPVCIVGMRVPGATPIVITSRRDATAITIVNYNFPGVNYAYVVSVNYPGAVPVFVEGAGRIVSGTLSGGSAPPPSSSSAALVLEGTATAIVLEGTLTAIVTE